MGFLLPGFVKFCVTQSQRTVDKHRTRASVRTDQRAKDSPQAWLAEVPAGSPCPVCLGAEKGLQGSERVLCPCCPDPCSGKMAPHSTNKKFYLEKQKG